MQDAVSGNIQDISFNINTQVKKRPISSGENKNQYFYNMRYNFPIEAGIKYENDISYSYAC